MKIGIFGGSFNPPHKMHKKIALHLIKKGYLDKVIYVPTGSKYEYKNNLLDDKRRLEMLKLMCNDNKLLEVSDYELKDKVIYTYQTLNYFKNKYKNDEIYFICGTDNLSYLDKWKKGKYLLKNYKFIIIKRKGNKIKDLLKKYNRYKSNIIVTNIKKSKVSSTMIRNEIKNNNTKKVKKYVDEDVLNYIINNKLYY